jgi:hypothetical protein
MKSSEKYKNKYKVPPRKNMKNKIKDNIFSD